MKLYDLYSDKGFHTSVATSFGLDFDAYETIVLPRLKGAGCRNNIVVADSRMLTYALSDVSRLPALAGTAYTVTGAAADGVFHPKIFLQLGRRRGRLIVSSANLTTPGLAGNLEIAGVVECKSAGQHSRAIVEAQRGCPHRIAGRDRSPGLALRRDRRSRSLGEERNVEKCAPFRVQSGRAASPKSPPITEFFPTRNS
jgi:hypothetical protein